MPGLRSPCIVSLTSYLPGFNFFMCKYNYSKEPLRSHFPIWNLRILPTLGDNASPVRDGWGFWGSDQTCSTGVAGDSALAWTGSLRKAPACFAAGFTLQWLLPGKQPAAFPRPCSGPSKPPLLLGTLGFEVGLFRRLSPEQEPASRGLSGPVPGSVWKLTA